MLSVGIKVLFLLVVRHVPGLNGDVPRLNGNFTYLTETERFSPASAAFSLRGLANPGRQGCLPDSASEFALQDWAPKTRDRTEGSAVRLPSFLAAVDAFGPVIPKRGLLKDCFEFGLALVNRLQRTHCVCVRKVWTAAVVIPGVDHHISGAE